MDFGFGAIPLPVIALLVILVLVYSMRKKKVATLRKENDRLKAEISNAHLKQELKELKDKGRTTKKDVWG